MSSVDNFLISTLARDLKDEVMVNVRSYAAIATSPENAKMAFGLMDTALNHIIVPTLRDHGAEVRDGTPLCHRVFELRTLYQKVQDGIERNGSIDSSVYKTIYEMTRAIIGRRKAAEASQSAASAATAPPVSNPESSVKKEVVKVQRRSTRVKSAPYVIDSDGVELESVEVPLIDLSDNEDDKMKIDDDGTSPSTPSSSTVPANADNGASQNGILKHPARPTVILMPYHQIPGIDQGRLFLKAQRTLAKAESTSKANLAKKTKPSRDGDMPVGNDVPTVNANLQMVQTRISNTDFEIAYLTRCLSDLHEQEAALRQRLKDLEKAEKANRKGKSKATE